VLVQAALGEAQRDIGLFLGTMSWVNLGLGAATGLAMAAIGLPNPVLWGAVTAALAFIPYLGPAAAAVALLLAGSVAFGTGAEMLAPPAAFLALHAVEANLLTPLLMGRRLRLSPVFVFLSVMAWGWLWGVAGAFLAVPLLLALRAACRRARRLRPLCRWLEGDGEQVPPRPAARHPAEGDS
jgi:predicted PurR-regulated permease PerM